MGSLQEEVSESAIQIAIVEYLSLHAERRGFIFWSCPNEAMGKARGGGGLARMARLKKMGLRAGVSDLIIIKTGIAYCLEVKEAKGKQSPSQIQFEQDCIKNCTPYAVAHSFEEAEKILRKWQITI